MNTHPVRFAARALRRAAAVTSYLLRLLVIAYLIAPPLPRVAAEEVRFQLPLERASHSFSLRQWDAAANAFITSPLQSLGLTHLEDDGTGTGTMQPTANSYLDAVGNYSLYEDYVIVDETTGETAPPNRWGTPSFTRTSFLETPWFANGEAATSFFVTLPESGKATSSRSLLAGSAIA